ncbi:MAG: methyl-accepting chemotaxis protein [Syntrophomonadaceae bacterium]
MAKKLSQPSTFSERTNLVSKDEDELIAQKREQARKMAQEKSRARTLAKQQAMAERIASAADQLVNGVSEANTAAHEFATLADEVATASANAGYNAEKVREASIQLNDSARAQARVLDDLMAKSNLVIAAAQESIQTMKDMAGLTKVAASKNTLSGKRVQDLEVQSQRIGDIVQAVVMIADQTNLLALNAAIEAARAGEHGRGFAVVADEVRNLAEISERSARDIRGVVEEIRNLVTEVVKDINLAVDNFNSMADVVEEAVEGFTQVGELVTGYGQKFMGIKVLSEGMGEMAGKLLSFSDRSTAATDEAAAGTREISKSVAEQSKALAEVNTACQELSEMAEDLKTSTNTSKSAEEVAASAEQLSANIEEMSSTAAEIAGVILSMNEGINSICQESKEALVLMQSAQNTYEGMSRLGTESGEIRVTALENLEASRSKAREIVQLLNDSTKSYEVTNASLNDLQDKIRRIEKIVDTIQNVSIQTNMLAVNGFVEAATAGEHGRGFSVVASDIRNLATESAENADKIKDLIREIQNLMGKVMTDINQSETAAQEAAAFVPVAVKKNSAVNDAFAEIDRVRAGYWETVQGIKNGLETNSEQIGEMSNTVGKVEGMIKEATVVGQEQARSIEELAGFIEDIASVADEMQMG